MHDAHTSGRVRPFLVLAVLSVGVLVCADRAPAQSVPGFTVETFATPTFPQLLAFGAEGVLYAGRDDDPTGSATPNFVTEITPDGATAPYGMKPIPDPDALVVDTTGIVTGTPGTVLVGGLVTLSGPGRVSAIAPDGTVSTFAEAPGYGNISEMKIDQDDRLLFVSFSDNAVYAAPVGETPSVLFPTASQPVYLEVAPDGRILTSTNNGVVAVHASDGTVIDGSFAMFNGRASIEFAEGGGFGDDLLAFESSSGTLYTVNERGEKTQIGEDFVNCDDLAIGPCGTVYLSCRLDSIVYRISGPPTPDLDGSGAVDGADLGLLLGAWGSADCAADLNQDGDVNGADLGILLGAWTV